MTEAVFRETAAEPRTQAVPLSHLSLELGHLYMEDFEAGPEHLRRHFERVRPWAEAGATWWIEAWWGEPGGADRLPGLFERVRQGPPRME